MEGKRRILSIFCLFVLFVLLVPASSVHAAINPTLFGDPVGQLSFTGNSAFTQDLLEDQILTRTSRWYDIFSTKQLDQRELEFDLLALEYFYRRQGFPDAKVDVEGIALPETKVGLTFSVVEGPRYRFGYMNTWGNEPVTLDEVHRVLLVNHGEIFDFTRIPVMKNALRRIYADCGHPYLEIRDSLARHDSSGTADWDVILDPGTLVRIGAISPVGSFDLDPEVVMRELTFKAGDLYSRARLAESQERIYETGLFSYVGIVAENIREKPVFPRLRVGYTARPPLWLGARVGAGQDLNYDLTFDLVGEGGYRNLWHRGHGITLRGQASFQGLNQWETINSRFDLEYSWPWLFGFRNFSLLAAYYTPERRLPNGPYRTREYGTRFQMRYPLARKNDLIGLLQLEWIGIYGIVDPDEAARVLAGNNLFRRPRLGLSWVLDTRVNPLISDDGASVFASLDMVGGPLGGDNHFLRGSASWARYQRIGAGFILASRVKLGGLTRLRDVPVPYLATDAFYAGGGTSIRGYPEQELMAKSDSGVVEGRKFVWLGNLELRHPLPFNFSAQLFLDAGDVWNTRSELTTYYSIGAGLAYLTPIGPVRVERGWRMNHLRGGESSGAWHLGILYAF